MFSHRLDIKSIAVGKSSLDIICKPNGR